MTDNQYKIELGVKLKDDDIQTQINVAQKTLKPIELKVDAETKELTSTIREALDELSKGTKNAFTLDTSKIEKSLDNLSSVITSIKDSLGALDSKSGMKDLLSSINQMAKALGKAESKSDSLVKSLSALSKKDFSLNIGIKSGSNPASRNALYGDRVKEIFPQLQQQKDAIIKYIQEYYEEIYAAEIQARKSAGNKKLINKGSKVHNTDPLSIISDLTGVDINKAWELFEKTSAPLKTTGKNKDNLKDRMNEINDLINSLMKGAEAKGIDLSSVVSEFSTSSNELVKSASDIQTGAKETEESFKHLKQVIGGGSLDVEGLGQVLKPLCEDIQEIKKAFESLSSIGTIDGLTVSFRDLSEVLEKLTSNITVVKQNLDNIGNLGGSIGNTGGGIENLEQDLKQVTTAAENTAKAMQYVREVLSVKGISNTNIDKVATDLQNLGIEIKNVTTRATKNGLNISVKGIDDLGRAVTVVRQFDKDFRAETIAQSFDTSADAVKRWKKEVSNAYQDAKKVTQQIGNLEVDLIGAKAKDDVKEIDRINNRLDTLRKKLGDIKSVYGDSFTTRHNNLLKELEDNNADKKLKVQNSVDYQADLQDAKKVQDAYSNIYNTRKKIGSLEVDLIGAKAKDDVKTIDAINDEITRLKKNISSLDKGRVYSSKFTDAQKADIKELNELIEYSKKQAQNKVDYNLDFDKAKAEVKKVNQAYEQMLDIQKQIRSLSIEEKNLNELGKTNELNEVTSKLKTLKSDYEALKRTFGEKLTSTQFGNLQAEIDDTESELKQLDAKFADTRMKLAKAIKLDIEVGTYDNQISQMDDRFNRLSNASKELRESVEQVHKAYERMELAIQGTGDEVADRERLIQAEKELARALEKTNNLSRIQARIDKDDNDRLKLVDDRQIFQSKIDAWLTKNSAATKKFGAAMLDLKSKAENCDRVNLNHLEKEFKQLDYAADKAGLKIQSTLDRVKSKFKEYMAYFSVAEVFMYVEQGLREMFNTVKEIDTAMTGLYRVTDLTASQYDTLFNNMISSAKEYGATLNDIINATTDWVRAGFDADTALGMAEVTTMYQHISDLDYDTASENLITAYNGFKNELLGLYDGDEVAAVNYIADVFNELDNNFAVTSAGLGEAMKRSASALDLAGNTIQETAG